MMYSSGYVRWLRFEEIMMLTVEYVACCPAPDNENYDDKATALILNVFKAVRKRVCLQYSCTEKRHGMTHEDMVKCKCV